MDIKKDISYQLSELQNLQDGWLDGECKQINPSLIELCENFLHKFVDRYSIDKIYLYPSYESGISVEWEKNNFSFDIIFSPDGKFMELSIVSNFDKNFQNDIYHRINVNDGLEKAIQICRSI